MARSQANLQFGVFRGLAGLSMQAKLLYLAILVDPAVNQSGVGVLRLSRWARELEVEHGDAAKALAELDAARFVLADYDTDEILVRTLIRNDGVADQPNVLLSALRHAVLCESPRLRRALAAELRRLPPKPPDKVHPTSGRRYVYPDPHAVADELDPRPPSGGGEPLSEPFREPFAEPFREGSQNRDEPDETRRVPGRVPGRDAGRLGGGGGGGGSSSSDVATQVSNGVARATRARTREARSPAGWNATARANAAVTLVNEFAATCPHPVPRKILIALGRECDELAGQGWTRDDLAAVLALWGTKALGPGALQSVAQEWANRRAAPPPRARADIAADTVDAAFNQFRDQLRPLPENVHPLPRAVTEGA